MSDSKVLDSLKTVGSLVFYEDSIAFYVRILEKCGEV
jgi:hypothetical protein